MVRALALQRMRIETIQAADEFALDAMMVRTIRTSVRLDAMEMADAIDNVRANMQWALSNAAQCVHLKCVDDGRIVGAVLVKHFWNLCSLFIEPGYQRRGLGRSLVEEAIKQCARQNERPYIKVVAAPNALDFYRAMGFTLSEDSKRGASSPMVLPLEPR
jgi:GNAT superfamily N-acetyltransferase